MNSMSLMLLLQQIVNKSPCELDDEIIELINGLKLFDFEILSRTKIEFLKFDFDAVKFKRAIEACREAVREQDMIIEYIKLGASAPMMRALFGHNATEVGALREKLGLSEKGGRPAAPTVAEQLAIANTWSASYKMDEREHYLYVAKKTGLSLRMIWNEINSYDAPDIMTKQRRESTTRGVVQLRNG